MKFLLCLLILLVSSQTHAQGVEIEPAPLSVEDDGTRKIINRKEGDTAPIERVEDVVAPPAAEALVIPNDEVINPPVSKSEVQKIAIEVAPTVMPAASEEIEPANPLDGQLSLDGPAVSSHGMVSDDLFFQYEPQTLKKYLQYSFGYLNSHYKKIHPSLKNGSTMMSFKFVADMSARLQSGFSVEVLSDKSTQTVPDNIRVLQYRIFVDYHAPLFSKGLLRIDWLGGIGFSVGDFGIRRRYTNSLGQEVSVKLKDGIIAGLVPSTGVRIYLFDKNSFDIIVEYHQYFSTPQRYIGGLAIAPRLSFEF